MLWQEGHEQVLVICRAVGGCLDGVGKIVKIPKKKKKDRFTGMATCALGGADGGLCETRVEVGWSGDRSGARR